MSALFPGSLDETGFWRDILAGRDLIREVPPTHWLVEDYYDPDPTAPDKTYARRGAFLEHVPFDPLAFGVPPSIVPATDTSQLLALIVAGRVLDEASGGQFASMNKDRISVILGVTSGQDLLGSMVSRLQRPVWVKSLREAGVPESKVNEVCDRIAAHYVPWQESTFPGLLGNVVAGRIANRFDLGGTNCVTDAACASAFSAVSMAVNELYLGQSDMVITGGVDTLNSIFMYMCFSKTPALSKNGDCRPFSDAADGTMLGEGLAMFALKRLDDAERANDRIYAVLRGVGTSSDGRAMSVYAPRAEGQASALRRAYEVAGYSPGTVELVEAHGTGTKAGDVAEIEGLGLVFKESGRSDHQWCALGSVKSQIGHTKAASGAAGLFKAVMALHQGVLPPTIKVDRPNPALALEDGPFYLNTKARPWIRAASHPRRASVSSFGFGGSNFHLTLEEYAGPAPHAALRNATSSELVVLGAADFEGLASEIQSVPPDMPGHLTWFARSTQERATTVPAVRLAILASDGEDLRRKLAAALGAMKENPGQPFSLPGGIHCGRGPVDGKLAFLFPGQGSQYADMGASIAMTWPRARSAFDLAADIVKDDAVSLPGVVFPRPAFTDAQRSEQEAVLRRTEWAQPAIAATSIAVLNLLDAAKIRPDMAAGHSFGEIMALYCAGVLDAKSALAVARQRGLLMAAAATIPGAMTAVFAPIEQISPIIANHPDVVVANHNAPAQIVLSGPIEAMALVERRLEQHQVRFERLAVATAFHSPIVASAGAPFSAFLDGIGCVAPSLPVYSNVSAAPHAADATSIRRMLASQLTSQVRFVEMVEAMHDAGARTFVEVGPSAVLTGLTAQILAGRPHTALSLDARGRDGTTRFLERLGQLWGLGYRPDFASLWAGFARPNDPREKQTPAMSISICGANHGQPYPPPEGARALPPPNPEPEPHVPAESVAVSVPMPGMDAPVVASAQREIAEAHMAWQNAMTQAHLAYLKVVESSFAARPSSTVSAVDMPAAVAAPVVARAASPQPVRAPARAAAEPKTSAPIAPPATAPEVRTEKPDLKTALIEVVAEKTGYPATMLNLEMALEADLGIDSIKRVEILSALDARVPGLPKIDLSAMVSMRTLGAIVAAIDTVEAGAPKNGPAVVVTPSKPAAAVESFAVKAVRRTAPGVGIPGLLHATRLVVTEDAAGVADALLSRLQQLQIKASKVATIPSDADAVIWLGGLAPDAGFENAMAVTRDCFHAAQVLAPRFSSQGGVFVTVQDTGGDFGLSGHDRAWLGGVAGIAKTAAVEWPDATVKILDVETAGRTPDAVAQTILSELLHGGRSLEVGFSATGDRIVVQTEKQGPAQSPERARASSFVLATGGGRGITAACLEALAKKEHGRFLLLGRTVVDEEPAVCSGVAGEAGLKKVLLEQAQRAGQAPSPAQLGAQVRHILAVREIKSTLESIERAGGQARYASVDVRDVGAVRIAIEAAKAEWGPVTDLVHGAGVIEDRPIAAKTDGQFDDVLATKVFGLRALLEATAGEPLGRILLFSSAAARSGNPGQCDYAAANEVLNKVAALEQRRRGGACVVKAFGWGPWAGGMVSPALQKHFEQRGTPVIPMADGCRIFVDAAVRTNEDGVETVIGSLDVQKPTLVPEETTFEMLVHPATQPFLGDHAIDTVVVLPVALVVEWFAAAARALHPDQHVRRIRDLRVLKGARLPDFADSGHVFAVHCKRIQNGADHNYAMTTLGPDGVVHHSAVVELSETMLPAQVSTLDAPAAGPFTGRVYGHALFHGPCFQMIRDVSALSMTGARARLVGTRALDWKGSWSTDAAAFDGALQLALLWSAKMHGGRSLPTSIAEIRFGAAGPADQPLTCVLGNGETHGYSSVCDLSLRDSNGTVVFELAGVELFRRPDAPGVVEMRT